MASAVETQATSKLCPATMRPRLTLSLSAQDENIEEKSSCQDPKSP